VTNIFINSELHFIKYKYTYQTVWPSWRSTQLLD